MKSLTIAISFIAVTFSSIAQNTRSLAEGESSPPATIDQVGWIAGHWQGEAFGGITEEFWSPPMAGSMMCAFRLITDDKVGFYEFVTITEENGKLVLDFAPAPQLKADLSHWHYDTYKIEWRETHAWFDFGTLKFVLDNNQAVEGIEFDVPNNDIFFEEIHLKKMN